jgi:hypothetical protein
MEIHLAVVTIDKWEVVGAIASTVNAIASLVAISFVAIQLKSSNLIAQAQLINELERDIAADTYVYVALESKECKDIDKLTDEQRIGVLKCISFFERVHLILETKVVDIEVIDRTFAGRFFILFNNPKVQEIMSTTEISPFMTSTRDLYSKWYVYRKEKGLPLTGFRDIIP